MKRLNKKLQLNKIIIAQLDSLETIKGGEAVYSINGYKCVVAKPPVPVLISDAIKGTCGGIVSDDCGFTGYTKPEWGHICW